MVLGCGVFKATCRKNTNKENEKQGMVNGFLAVSIIFSSCLPMGMKHSRLNHQKGTTNCRKPLAYILGRFR